MKKLLFILITISFFGCAASKNIRKDVCEKKEANIEKWANEFATGKITSSEFQWLIQAQKEIK